MARPTGPKCRLCRREALKLFLKGERCYTVKCPLDKKGAVPPGMHGIKIKRKLSDYGKQLREKQKAKRTYELLEKQFKKYFTLASKDKAATADALFTLLERRLDNVIYRLGLTIDRTSARQLITHGHVLLNQEKHNIPSYLVKKGDIISLSKNSYQIQPVKKALEDKKPQVPTWLERQGPLGKVIAFPGKEDIDNNLNKQLIVEYYSR